MAKIDDKQAAACFGTVIVFWVIWVSAYVALLILHRISVMKWLWKIMSDELNSIN